MNKLALYCRIGFEKEVAAEITDRASERGVFGFARVVENSGYRKTERCDQQSKRCPGKR